MKRIDMKQYVILQATPEMIPQIASIEIETFSDPWSEHSLSTCLPDDQHDFFVAMDEDRQVLGYISFMSVLDEGYINNVAVREEARHVGIGSALVNESIRRGKERKLSFLTLEVRASNDPAIALYEKHGFVEVGRRRGYYEKPKEDAILMTLFFEETEAIDEDTSI